MAELAAAAVSGVASKATESTYDFIRRQISYVFQYQRYIEDVKKQVEELKNARQRVDVSVEDAKRQGEEIFKDVEEWQSSVDNFMEVTAQSIIQDEDDAKKWCFKGLSPNLIKLYKLSKKARKAADDGDNLFNKIKNFSTVSHRPVLQKTKSIYVKDDNEPHDSRMSKLQDIMKALEDANIKLIGVYGMGGVGKTTLVSKVAWQAMEDKLFDRVVMAEVTQTPDYKKIREKIADDLGLEFDKETEVQIAHRIRDKLKKEKSVLIILDNIWKKVDLEAVGIPFGYYEKERKDNQTRWKILLTSRNQFVLSSDMKTQKNFVIETLSDGEAKNLFKKIVGDLLKKPDYHHVAVEIIKKCAGLPLAIATIANALKGKELCAWKDTLNKLEVSSSEHTNEVDTEVFSPIKLSYEFLESNEAKKIFLLCSLYNAGYEIYIYDLLRFGVGLSLFQGAGKLEQKRDRLCTLVNQLKASCLLLDGNTKDTVKMHDIIHAVAVSIASKDEHMSNIQDVTDLEQKLEEIPEDSTAISLLFKDINELPERLEFSELKLFMLFEKDRPLQIPDLFFEGTKQLKVLDFKGIYLQSLPPSFLYLTNLRTLSLKACRLGGIAMIGELKRLEILSFSDSDIEQLPKEIGQLARLKCLDLSNCLNLKVIAPNVMSQLSQLEELYMGNSFVQWEAKGLNDQGRSNASLIELKELSRLTTLDIHVQDAQVMPRDLNFENLERYRIFIGDVWKWFGKYETSRTLKLKLNSYISLRYEILTLLRKSEDLYLDELNGVHDVLYGLDDQGFPQLKHLHVQRGSEILYIINSEGSAPCNAFPSLESLYLHNLINLEKICHCQLKEESFSNLRVVSVVECDRLKHLFSISLSKNLSQLQNIEVTNCKNLTEIFSQESEDHVIQNERNNKIEFSQLRSLTLQDLPQLKGFVLDMNSSLRSQNLVASNMGSAEIISEDESLDFVALFSQKVVFPCLENLKLSSISIGKIWPNELPATPSYSQTLMSITVEKCSGLKFLFSSSMVKCLLQLQILEICHCKSMEEIINTEGLRREEKIVKFPKLSKLVLESLPKLTRFGIGDLVEFPSLKELEIDNCPNLETFLSSSSCAKMVNKGPETMNSDNCNADICQLFDEKVRFPNLKAVTIKRMHNMSRMWPEKLSLDSFSKLQDLTVRKCNQLLSIVPSNMLGRLQRLETLLVSDCVLTNVIFEPQALGEEIPTQLRKLDLYGLPQLQCVWDMKIRGGQAFKNLVSMNVKKCKILKSLFPISIAKSLHQLEELEISDCNELKEIVAMVEGTESVLSLAFPKLISLRLNGLSRLETFFPETHISEWPVLKRLEVIKCANVEIFASKSQHDISHQQPLFLVDKVGFPNLEELTIGDMHNINRLWPEKLSSDSFSKLKDLRVMNCNNLCSIVPPNVLGRLQRLETLLVSNCVLIDVIFEPQALGEEIPTQLRKLKLNGLPQLRCVWDVEIKEGRAFGNLVSIFVEKCNSLKSLFPISIAKSLHQLEELEIRDCNNLEEIIAKVEGIKAVPRFTFPKLTWLTLDGLSRLKTLYLGTHISEWPVLKKLAVIKCAKVMIFASELLSFQETQGESQRYVSHQQPLFLIGEVGFPNLKALTIKQMHNMSRIWPEKLSSDSFSKLQNLTVMKCNQLLSIVPSNMLGRLQSLETLLVSDCVLTEMIFEPQALSEEILTQLRKLDLHGLCNLLYVCDKKIQGAFQNLVSMKVKHCKSLESLFPTAMAKSLHQLEELEISDCYNLKEIVAKVEGIERVPRFVFPKLTWLKLSGLSILETFFPGTHISEWPVLKKLLVMKCGKVTIFAFEFLSLQETQGESQHYISHQQPLFFVGKDAFPSLEKLEVSELPELLYLWKENSQSMNSFQNLVTSEQENSQLRSIFQNLVSLEISRCVRLRYVVNQSTVKNLLQLQKMIITNCKMMETIIIHFGDEVKDQIVFNQLECLELYGLDRLRSFCSGKYTLEFPFLKQVTVSQCSKMEIFSQGVLNTPRLQNVQLTRSKKDEGYGEGNLNSTTKHCLNEWIQSPT